MAKLKINKQEKTLPKLEVTKEIYVRMTKIKTLLDIVINFFVVRQKDTTSQ